MEFQSILSEGSRRDDGAVKRVVPAFFGDLNLDQLVGSITADWHEYDLESIFYTRLSNLEEITYRQEVMRDFEDDNLINTINLFSGQMRAMRQRREQAKKLYYKYAIQRCFLSSVEIYCKAVEKLWQGMLLLEVKSRAFIAFRDYLESYAASVPFRRLSAQVQTLRTDLSAIKYCLLIKGGSVTIRNCDEENNYSTAIEETFAKFRCDTEREYSLKIRSIDGTNHIQEQVLKGVAQLYPEIFRALDVFWMDHAEYLDEIIARFDREVQFYVAYLTYIAKFKQSGLTFCQPQLSQMSKEICCRGAFDIALAEKLIADKSAVICNDFSMSGVERIFVVSGPNHGGKTTFARMFGQLHYLACLGCPVPGKETRLFLFDQLFTHFEREEHITNLRGKLQDDLVRIHQIFAQATPNSIIVMNEIFSSTTLKDAIYLSKLIMHTASALDLLGVCVTFLDELASFDEKTVSIVSTVDPENPAVRTYKLERRPADGLAYALAIAQKYQVTYDRLRERIQS